MVASGWILALTFIFLVILLSCIPYLTRKTESFGVSIPKSLHQRTDFKTMRKRYMLLLVTIGGVMLLSASISSFYLPESGQSILFLVFLVTFICISFITYLPFHFRMKQIKIEEKWFQEARTSTFIDTNFHREKRSISTWWYLIPLSLILITIGLTILLYEYMPDKIPMHTDFFGNVTYEKKTWSTALWMPGTQLFLLLIMFFTNYVLKSAKQQINSENPAESKQRNLAFRRKWSVFLLGMTISLELLLSLIQLRFIFPGLKQYITPFLILITGAILIWAVVLSVRVGQGGDRLKLASEQNQNVLDTDEDRFWKLGMFYFNKNDPAVFIEKRFGVGWTCNWARPLAWVLILVIVAIPVLITLTVL